MVKGLGVDVPEGSEETKESTEGTPGLDARGRGGSADATDAPANENINGANGTQPRSQWANSGFAATNDDTHQQKTQWIEENQQGRFENRFGRLVINEGKSRYINNSFWANLSNEVEDLKGILNQSSDDEDAGPTSPGLNTHMAGNHHGWVFGFSSQNVDLISLHPLPGQIHSYWQTYKENVDPLVKVLHIPTIEPTVLSAASHLSNLSKGFEALLFAIYYGATTSLPPEDCIMKFGEEKQVLLARYRFAIEQALARANFLTTEEIIVLQAFVIFLICLRRNNDARVIWTLTGLVVRIAQTIGVHRDGIHFGLAPFEIEMRRRLWWQVCILDTRASEDHGCDPTIIEQSFDTKMPLNINDVDISPGMKDFPPERQGCTDMSFCLIRFEVANTFRRINYIPPGPPRACGEYFASVTLQDKEKWITECHQRLEDRYLKHCDMSVPLFWVTATVARLMMSKMWLMVYHPFQRQDGGASLASETKDKLFITSLENIEYSLLLETEARTMKWGWLFKTYMQWHALAFILSELCQRTTGDLVERAWVAVDKTRDGRWGEHITDDTKAGHLWRPLKKLFRRAKEARTRGLQEEQLIKQRTNSMQPARTYSPNANPMFGHPKRPTVVRAPLSNAQLERFTQGPAFGQRPLDSHQLLKSPKLGDTAANVDAMDTAGLVNVPLTSLSQDVDQSLLNSMGNNLDFNQVTSSAGSHMLYAPLPAGPKEPLQGPQGFGKRFINGMQNVDYSDMDFGSFNRDLNSTASVNQNMSQSHNLPIKNNIAHPARMDSTSTDTFDNSIMDTSGDLNWENWDQLVRQFGMDVDSAPGDGMAANWAGPNWDSSTLGPNMRMGMGMGGGDWF